MTDNKDLLDKYRNKPYPPLEKMNQAPELVKTEIEEYQAVTEFKRDARSPRFRIVTADGNSYGCSYAHLLDWMFQPPTLLTINTATRIFTIEGKNLETIERLLLDERIKELQEFNPNRHKRPEKEAPLIERLEVTSH